MLNTVSPCLCLRFGSCCLGEHAGILVSCFFYDELLHNCVHTPPISPTPTAGLSFSWLNGFLPMLRTLPFISNVFLPYEAALLARLIYSGNVAAVHLSFGAPSLGDSIQLHHGRKSGGQGLARRLGYSPVWTVLRPSTR